MTGSAQYPTRLGHEREDVPRRHDVIGGRDRIDGHSDGLRTIGCGNPRGYPSAASMDTVKFVWCFERLLVAMGVRRRPGTGRWSWACK